MSQPEMEFVITYNQADTKLIELLRSELHKAGINVWLDQERVKPGQSWLRQLKKAVGQSAGLGVCIGPKGPSPEVNEAVEMALARRDAGESYQVIPILLPGASATDIPHILRGFTFLDLREWGRNSEVIARLVTAIKEGDSLSPDDPAGKHKPHKSNPSPSIPKAPAIGFVRRHDAGGEPLLKQVCDELAPEKRQLLALWGAGGVGKTTLAAEAARDLEKAFAQRIVWVSADNHAELTLAVLLDDIATQLGNPKLRLLAPDLKEEQVRGLITAAPTLIVLDNFEVIAPEEQMNCIEWLAQRAPCSTLATSREMIRAARNINVPPMSRPEAQEFLDRLVTAAHEPAAFSATMREQVIRVSNANPQVMTWLAAQVSLSDEPQALVGELAAGSGDACQSVFDRYFSLPQLTDDGRAVLLALSLFLPSASREALSEVAGIAEKNEDFGRLAEAVKKLSRLGLVKHTGRERYVVEQGLTRSLAKARLKMDASAEKFYRRFVAYFLNYADTYPELTPEDLDSLEAEKENLLAAFDLAYALQDWQTVMRLMNAVAFPGMLDIRGYWDEALRRGKQAIKAAHAAKDESAAAYFSANAANIRQYRGEYREARRAYNQAISAFKKLGQDANVAATLHQLGTIAFEQGSFAEAQKSYEEALGIAQGLGDQQGIASSLHQLARIMQLQGNFAEARELHERTLAIARKLGDQSAEASSLHQLAINAQAVGDLKKARKLYDESLEITKRLGDQSGIAITLHQLGGLSYSLGEVDEARRLFYESLAIKKRLGDQSGIASTLHNLALLAQSQEEIEEARRLYNESLEIARKLGDQHSRGSTLHQLALIAAGEGNVKEAERLFRESLGIFEKLGSPSAEMARRNLETVKAQRA